jgi:sulfide:quinone oxidoreductase
MAHIVVIGAGIGGMPLAYEMKEAARPQDRVTVIANNPKFHFVPSNPWVAVSWRVREDIELELGPLLARKKIGFVPVGARRLHPEANRVVLENGEFVDYDFLVIATGPKLAFDEVEGLGPQGHTESICHVDHAVHAD